MPLTFQWTGATTLPVDAPALVPEAFRVLSATEAARRPVGVGNGEAELGELFAIQGSAEDGQVIVEGDLRWVARIGQGMTSGHLLVRGDAGMELGAGMS